MKCKCKNRSKAKGAGLIIGGAAIAAGIAYMAWKNCKTIPKGINAIKPFDLNRYLGKWYEIARLDYSYEKNMTNVTAEYSLNSDGTVKVVNKGYDEEKNVWEESTGKAKFVDSPIEAKLKVSFFGPFYAGYNVIAIDPEYKYALVAGRNYDYLWLLSREKTMPDDVLQAYLQYACECGYDITELVWTEQEVI